SPVPGSPPFPYTTLFRSSGVVPNRLLGQLLQPFVDQAEAALRDDVFPISGDEPRGLALEAGLQVVIDGIGPLRARLEIRGGVDETGRAHVLTPVTSLSRM